MLRSRLSTNTEWSESCARRVCVSAFFRPFWWEVAGVLLTPCVQEGSVTGVETRILRATWRSMPMQVFLLFHLWQEVIVGKELNFPPTHGRARSRQQDNSLFSKRHGAFVVLETILSVPVPTTTTPSHGRFSDGSVLAWLTFWEVVLLSFYGTIHGWYLCVSAHLWSVFCLLTADEQLSLVTTTPWRCHKTERNSWRRRVGIFVRNSIGCGEGVSHESTNGKSRKVLNFTVTVTLVCVFEYYLGIVFWVVWVWFLR